MRETAGQYQFWNKKNQFKYLKDLFTERYNTEKEAECFNMLKEDLIMKKIISVILCAVMLIMSGAALADYPEKTIQLTVPFAAGGGTDAVARALANAAEKYLGQSVVIVNTTGGSGAVGLTDGAGKAPDGYNLTMITRELVTLPINGLCPVTVDNFELICNVNLDPGMVTVAANSPIQSLQELLDEARKTPGALKFASTATPNMYAYTVELDQDIIFNHIPFNGAAEAIPEVLGGHADFTITSPGEAISQVLGGQMRALAVMSEERLEALPDVPTFKELGIDIVTGTWRGIAAPKNTPADVVAKLRDAFAKAVQDEDFVSFMKNASLNIYYLDAESYAKFIAEDTETASAIFSAIQ